MSLKLITLCLIISVLFISCKTTEQIQREKLVENLSSKIITLQKENADLGIAIQDLQERISHMQGKKGEREYKEKKQNQEMINRLQAEIEILQQGFNGVKQEQSSATQELIAQKKYLQEVLKTLGKISGTSKRSKRKSPYSEAMNLYNAGKCKSARPLLKRQANNRKLKSTSKAKVLHHLGVCEFKLKNYDASILSLSKLVTSFKNSYFVKNALYYLGKNFTAKGQKDEAKQAFQEVIKRYPKSKQSKWAKNRIKEL